LAFPLVPDVTDTVADDVLTKLIPFAEIVAPEFAETGILGVNPNHAPLDAITFPYD
jgi:hypothetical protein